MKSHSLKALLAGVIALSLPYPVAAQGARVVVTVLQTLNRVTSPAAGAAVCFTSTTNTKLADANGVVTFDNVPAGQWSAVGWKSGFQAQRADITVSGTGEARGQIMLLNRSLAASPCILPPPVVPARLGDEQLEEHGNFPTEGGYDTWLDCRDFGPKYVMVRIEGKHGQAIDKIRVGCSEVGPGATISNLLRWTQYWGEDNLLAGPFERHCDDDQAVMGIRGRIEDGQVRSIRIMCKAITAAGLTTGAEETQDPAGGTAGTVWPPDRCNEGRPARGIRVAKFHFGYPRTLSPLVISGVQLRCEQPAL